MKTKRTILFVLLILVLPHNTFASEPLGDILYQHLGMSSYIDGMITPPHCISYGDRRLNSCQYSQSFFYIPTVPDPVGTVQLVRMESTKATSTRYLLICTTANCAGTAVATSTSSIVVPGVHSPTIGQNITFDFPSSPSLLVGTTYFFKIAPTTLNYFTPYNDEQKAVALLVIRSRPPSPITLSNPTEIEDDNNQDAKGVAGKTVFTFGVTASGTPDTVNLVAVSENSTTTLPLLHRVVLGEYSATSTFPQGHYSYHFEASGGIKTEDFHFTAGYSNVAFLPGLEASRLYDADGKRLWEPEVFHDNSKLYMNDDGTSETSGIYAKEILDNAYVPIKGNVYQSFISAMNEMKEKKLIHDWKPFPYDWRYDVRDISGGMVEELQKLAESSDTGKVTLIGHSNGGLVAKVLAGKTDPKLLDQMIFVASPQAGTPSAIGAILHGFQQGLPFDWFHPAISPIEARTLAKNMPSAYGLLPSEKYFTYVDDPVITFDDSALLSPWLEKYGTRIHSRETLRDFLTDEHREKLRVGDELDEPSIGNSILLSRAENLHDALDNWLPPEGVILTQIAGWGEETLAGLSYYQGIKSACEITSGIKLCGTFPALEYKPKMVLDGDGTVAVLSALWTSGAGRFWVDLDDYNNTRPQSLAHFSRKHADILEIPNLLVFIQNILTRNGAVLPTYITALSPVTDSQTRLHFTLHSPLTLDLWDEAGNHTGISTTTNEIEENIPGSRYMPLGEVKYVSVPSGTKLSLIMNGYAEGSFTLDMEETNGTATSSIIFAGVPVSVGTIATIDIPPNGIAESSSLTVANAEGKTEFILAPKEGEIVIPDFTPPKKEEPKEEKKETPTIENPGAVFIPQAPKPAEVQKPVVISREILPTLVQEMPTTMITETISPKVSFATKVPQKVSVKTETVPKKASVEIIVAPNEPANSMSEKNIAGALFSKPKIPLIVFSVVLVGLAWFLFRREK